MHQVVSKVQSSRVHLGPSVASKIGRAERLILVISSSERPARNSISSYPDESAGHAKVRQSRCLEVM